MKNNLPQDIETRLTVAEGLCKLFQKKNKEKVDQFKPIYKQTDINDKLTLIIDGTPVFYMLFLQYERIKN